MEIWRRAVDTVRSVQAARRRDSDEGEYQLGDRVVDVQEEGMIVLRDRLGVSS